MGPGLGKRGLARKPVHQPADDPTGDEEHAERERDPIPDEAGTGVEVMNPPPLREDEEREQQDRDNHCTE